MGLRASLDRCVNTHHHPGFDPWSDQPIVSHYINYAIHPSSAVVVYLYQFQGLLQDQLLFVLCHDYISAYTINLSPFQL
jgi:hypothetical protein